MAMPQRGCAPPPLSGRLSDVSPPLLFTPAADEQLASLQANPGHEQLYDRINDVLDQIEDAPTAVVVRRQRYLQPPLWGVPVHGSGEDWLILWEESPNESLVHYIGVRL